MSILSRLLPAQTSPATKFIRTGEGALLFLFNLGSAIAAVLANIPAGQALKWVAIANSIGLISRTGLKMVLAFAQSTGLQPMQIPGSADIDTLAATVTAQVLSALKGRKGAGQVAGEATADSESDLPELKEVVSDVRENEVQPPANEVDYSTAMPAEQILTATVPLPNTAGSGSVVTEATNIVPDGPAAEDAPVPAAPAPTAAASQPAQ